MSVIPHTQEAEAKRLLVSGQPGQRIRACLKKLKQKHWKGPGEVVQRLGAHTIPSEDLSSVPIVVWLITTITSSSSGIWYSGLHGDPSPCIHMHMRAGCDGTCLLAPVSNCFSKNPKTGNFTILTWNAPKTPRLETIQRPMMTGRAVESFWNWWQWERI